MAFGDHIRVWRGTYYHHGIDRGDGWVIHFTGELGRKANAMIQWDTMQTFANGGQVEIVRYNNAHVYSPSQVMHNAESRLGEAGYNLAFNNCEHFATWCKTGRTHSEQVKDAGSTAVGAVGSGAAAAAGIGVVGAAGSVAGLSGAGVMSGLAAVGGSAVGGIATLGAAPAVVTTLAMRQVLADDESLPQEERDARQAGRVATVAGAGAGTAGAIGAISAAGSVAGLSGAGITSGLAAIGGTVGGGMVAGTVIAVAAPAAAAAAVGFGVYKVWKWLSD